MKRIIYGFCVALLLGGCGGGRGVAGIATRADFVAFSEVVNAGGQTDRWQDSTGVVRLLNDIDLSSIKGWMPIGYDDVNAFTGVFDGGGFTISGLRIDSDSLSVGLFGKNRGVIRNVVLDKDCTIHSRAENGFVGGVCGENFATIEGCVSYATVSSTVGCAGGVVGRALPETKRRAVFVRRCENYGAVSSGGSRAGGIVGWGYRVQIDSCLNAGVVKGTGWFCGGICGVSGAQITACENRGAITGNHYAGGIVGASGDEGIVSAAINRGVVIGKFAGAIAGEIETGAQVVACSNEGSPASFVAEGVGEEQPHVHTAACQHTH